MTSRWQVWFLQEYVWHYRIPIWDLLRKKAEKEYWIRALGNLKDGQAHGGISRPYLQHLELDTIKLFGQQLTIWPGLEREISLNRPDVIVVQNNPRNSTLWRLPKICHSQGIPVIGWSKIHGYSGMSVIFTHVLKRHFYKKFDYMLCYGQQSFDELVALGYPQDRILISQNTIDTSRFVKESKKLKKLANSLRQKYGLSNKRILLSIGTMKAKKRHRDLIEAWKKLRKIDENLHLVLVGGGPTLNVIREMAKVVDDERILVTGFVPEGEDYAWIEASDVNIFAGGLGLAINQCLAAGKPTIVADESGSDSEILKHGETGWRYPKGDIDSLVRSVEHVLNNSEKTRLVAKNGKRLMRQGVTIENMVEKIDSMIRRAIRDWHSH